jgi:hypothetical protein
MTISKALLIVALLALGFWWSRPRPIELQLRELLDRNIAKVQVQTALSIFDARLRAHALGALVAPTFQLQYRAPDFELDETYTRTRAVDAASSILAQVSQASAAYSNFKLERSAQDTARVSLFLIAEWKRRSESEASQAAEELLLDFQKIEGDWLLVRIETIARAQP